MTAQQTGRLAVLFAAVAYMQVGSAMRIGMGIKDPWFAKSWRMYHGRGLDQCEMDVFHTPPGGERVAVDWVTGLGRAWYKAPHIEEHADVARHTSALCRAFPGEVNIVTTCASLRGYKRPSPTAGLDVCATAPARKRSR